MAKKVRAKPKRKNKRQKRGIKIIRNNGRPEAIFLPEFTEQVFSLCLLGARDTEIAGFFGVSEATYYKWLKKYPDFKKAVLEGKLGADASVAVTQYEIATDKKHFQSASTGQFWLRNRRPKEWNVSNKQEITGKDGKPLMPQILVMTDADKKRLEEV